MTNSLTRLLAFAIGVLAAPLVGLVAGYVLEYYKGIYILDTPERK
jgi:hypothetical protein